MVANAHELSGGTRGTTGAIVFGQDVSRKLKIGLIRFRIGGCVQ